MPTSKILIDGVGIDLSGSTLTAGSMLDGTTGLDANGNQVTGNIQMQAAQTITPGLTAQTIASGKYLSGNQTIAAITKELLATLDADFAAENIKKGVDLFGLIGTLEGGGGGASFAYGNFIPSENIKSINITHGLGVVPNFVFVFKETYAHISTINQFEFILGVKPSGYSSDLQRRVNASSNNTDYNRVYARYNRNMTATPYYAAWIWNLTASTVDIGINNASGGDMVFTAGEKYIWVVGVI